MNEEILEGNKLIAEFMKVKFHQSEKITAYLVKYHSSWDWQIPAFGQIALAVKTLIPKFPKPEENGRWYFRNLDKYEKAIFNNEPIEGHKIVAELLKWYNQNKIS